MTKINFMKFRDLVCKKQSKSLTTTTTKYNEVQEQNNFVVVVDWVSFTVHWF